MPSGPKKRRAAKKKANNSSNLQEVKTNTDPADEKQDAALSSMDSSSSTYNLDKKLKESEINVSKNDASVDSAGKFDEDGNMGFKETETTILQIVEDVFLESVEEDVTNEEVPVIPQPVIIEKAESLKLKAPETGPENPNTLDYSLKLEEDFKAYDVKSRGEIRLEKFKNAVIEELRATEKMREFLVKLLDDINSIELN